MCQLIYKSPKANDAFFSLSDSDKERVIKEIVTWSETIIEFVSSGYYVSSTRDLVRYFLNRMNITVPKSFVEGICDGDIVELYNSDSTRLFFTPDLFAYSSYDPEEMYVLPWWKLYGRDDDISQEILKNVNLVCSGSVKEPYKPSIRNHVVQEVSSEHKFRAQMEFKLFSPFYAGGNLLGIASLSRLKLLNG
nr:hypothetical protein BdHM001_36560 [Bdellovibrio sp. HM001]